MSKTEQYKFSIPYRSKLLMVVCANRLAQKICRKCYKRPPLNATVCRSCKNSDLRKRKEFHYGKTIYLDKNYKKRIIDKRKFNN